MTAMSRRLDVLALAGAVLALAMAGVYLAIINDQADRPAWWFLVPLVLAGLAAAYASNRASPGRVGALFAAAAVLGAGGMLAILSIGLPILVAGILCLVAAVRGVALSSGSTPAA